MYKRTNFYSDLKDIYNRYPNFDPLNKINVKIEIWSDVMCPFCYIGKHHFEEALQKLPFKDEVEVEWKSFQLDPTLNPSETWFTIWTDWLSENPFLSFK